MNNLTGRRIKALFYEETRAGRKRPGTERYYHGFVTKHNKNTDIINVKYDDGEKENGVKINDSIHVELPDERELSDQIKALLKELSNLRQMYESNLQSRTIKTKTKSKSRGTSTRGRRATAAATKIQSVVRGKTSRRQMLREEFDRLGPIAFSKAYPQFRKNTNYDKLALLGNDRFADLYLVNITKK